MLLWVSGFREGPTGRCPTALQLSCTPFAPLRPEKQWTFVLGFTLCLTTTLGAFYNYSHFTGREIKAQQGDSTCPKAHSFRREHVLEVGCPDSISDAPCTVHTVRSPLVGAGLLACEELEGGLAFPYSPVS